jgi:signal transduction histidine kinase
MLTTPNPAQTVPIERCPGGSAGLATEHGSAGLRLAVGLLCSILGAEALVLPARFVQTMLSPWAMFVPLVVAVGIVLLSSGCLLIGAATLARPSWLLGWAGLWCALLLLGLASLRLAARQWSDAAMYGVLAVGLATESLAIPRSAATPDGAGQMGRVLGGAALIAGASTALNDVVPLRAWYAVLLCAGGAILLSGEYGVWGRAARTGPRLVCALALVVYGVQVPLQQRDWTAVTLYIGLGVALAFESLVRLRLHELTATSLRVRLVVTMVGVASLPMIAAASAIAAAAEAAAIADASADQQVAALNISRTIGQFDNDYRALVSTLAARGGFAGLPAERQREILLGLVATDVFAFSTYAASGAPSTRSDDKPGQALAASLVDQTTSSDAASVASSHVPGTERPDIVFAAPFHDADGHIAGFVAAEIDMSQLGAGLKRLGPAQRAGASMFLVDRSGGTVVSTDEDISPSMSTPPPPAAAVLGQTEPGTMQYQAGDVTYLAGFTPVPFLGWVAVASFPLASVLAGVQAGREVAFGILLLAAAVSALLGALVAERFVRPLSALGSAAEWRAVRELALPLPRSSFAEVQRLATIFGHLRESLAARTADRERALTAAREAAHAREEFLSVAAHELKTPVAALRGQTQLLMQRLKQSHAIEPGRLGDSLRRIDLQSHKLARLVELLLDVAHLERGTLSVMLQPVELGPVVEELIAAHPSNERIAARLPATRHWANIDELRFEQVMNNLLDNAVKFSPDGERIDVSLEVGGDSRLRVTVLDHGIGVPPQHRAKIFERFYQAHGSSHRSGLGLGLYVTRQIVELHEGTISVAFAPSGGSKFTIDLPSARVAPVMTAIAS